jgi:hypothetical protein
VARLPLITAPEVGDADLRGVMERLGGGETFGVHAHAPGPFKAFLAFSHAALAALAAGAAAEPRTEGRPA